MKVCMKYDLHLVSKPGPDKTCKIHAKGAYKDLFKIGGIYNITINNYRLLRVEPISMASSVFVCKVDSFRILNSKASNYEEIDREISDSRKGPHYYNMIPK